MKNLKKLDNLSEFKMNDTQTSNTQGGGFWGKVKLYIGTGVISNGDDTYYLNNLSQSFDCETGNV